MDAKAGGGRGAARNGNSSSNAATTSVGGGKKKRSKARKKATGAAVTAAAPSAASLGGAAGGNSAKKATAAAANAPHAPKSQTAVVAGNAGKTTVAGNIGKTTVPLAQPQQGQQGQPKKKKNRKRLHNGGKVAAANRAAGNESSSTSSNATQGATKMTGTSTHQALVVNSDSHSNAAATKPRPQTAAVLTRAAAASNAERLAKATGAKRSIPKPKIKVKRKIDEATITTAQTIPRGDRDAGKSSVHQPSASEAASSSHDADTMKQPPAKKLKVVNSVVQAKKQKAPSPDENILAPNRPALTPVAAPKPVFASLQQATKPQSATATASAQAAVTQEAASNVAFEPMEIESKSTESMEGDDEAPNASATQAELTSAAFAAEPFTDEEPLSGAKSSDVEVIEVEDSEPDSLKSSSTSEAFDVFPPATTPMVDSSVDDSAIVSTNAISAEVPFSRNATHSDESAASTPSPLHESENKLWSFSSPQQDPLSSVHEDPSASGAATETVESVSLHETSVSENIVINESTHADSAHEAGTNLLSDAARPSRESVDVPLREESAHKATSSSSTKYNEEQKKEDYHMREESEPIYAQEKEMTEYPGINAQGDGQQTTASSLMQKIVIPAPVRTPSKSEWLPPRPANAWGASFGMTVTPDRTSATLLSASSPALATSPLSSWFLSKGQANFVQQVAFPPRVPSERHHRRSVSPQRLVAKSHAQNSSSSLETALIANQEEDDDAEGGKSNAFLESLTQQASWRTWYGSVDQKDLLDPPLQQLPAEVRKALLDATSSGDLVMGAPGNQISSCEINEKPGIADLEDEIRAERDNVSAFTHELMLMLQGKTLSGKPLEEEYRALLVHGDPRN